MKSLNHDLYLLFLLVVHILLARDISSCNALAPSLPGAAKRRRGTADTALLRNHRPDRHGFPQPTVEIIGATGRMGSLFFKNLETTVAVPRGVVPGCLTAKPDEPILVCIPSKEWKIIYEQTPYHRRGDLVYIGNGMLHSDWQKNATVVIPHYGVVVRQDHEDPLVATSVVPTYIYGKHANYMAETLEQFNITVKIVSSWDEACFYAARKVLWASCLWLLCHQNKPPLSLQLVYHTKFFLLHELVSELFPVLLQQASDPIATTKEDLMRYLQDYSLSMPHVIPSRDLAMSELEERNGIWLQTNHTEDQRLHIRLLQQVIGQSALTALLSRSSQKKEGETSKTLMIPIPQVNITCTGQLHPSPQPRQLNSILIIGGGILGSSIARALHSLNFNVTILDDTLLGRTTPASWAWINGNQKKPHSYQWLNQLGMRTWRHDELLHSLPIWSGSLVSTRQPLPNDGYPSEGPLSRERIHELEPCASFSSDSFVYYFPQEGLVDPSVAVKVLRPSSVVQATVATLLEDPTQNHRVIGARAIHHHSNTTSDYFADVVIVAAGTGTAALGRVRLLQSAAGRIAFYKPSSTQGLTRILVDSVRQSHILQRPNGELVVGGGKLVFGGSQRENEEAAEAVGHKLLPAALQLAPEPLAESVHSHSEQAVRPVPKDGLPVVGYQQPGLYVAVTHSGVTLGPLLGQLIACELKHSILLNILGPYRPCRFSHLG